jgi:hypothetical protein
MTLPQLAIVHVGGVTARLRRASRPWLSLQSTFMSGSNGTGIVSSTPGATRSTSKTRRRRTSYCWRVVHAVHRGRLPQELAAGAPRSSASSRAIAS